MRRYGFADLADAVLREAHPFLGSDEDRRWQSQRIEVLTRALGISLREQDHPMIHRPLLGRLLRLLRHRRPSPLDGFLEAGLILTRYGDRLEPILECGRELDGLYEEEAHELSATLFGEIGTVGHADLLAAGLDESLEPDLDSLL